MSFTQTEYDNLKKVVLDILAEKPEVLEPIILKAVDEEKLTSIVRKELERMKISAMIDEDFDNFEKVFKVLA